MGALNDNDQLPAWWVALCEADDPVTRRFGSAHGKPCNRPEVITCARWQCQQANQCVEPSPNPEGVRIEEY